jgi:hypothetical protein
MKIKEIKTYQVTIYLGLEWTKKNKTFTYKDVKQEIQSFIDIAKFGVTLKETEFMYPGGREKGVEIGLINYPRFPLAEEEIKENAFKLAQFLLETYHQMRLSIVCSDKTYTLFNDVEFKYKDIE